MKKISLLLVLMMLVSAFTPVMAANDIEGHWANEIISKWIEAEKVGGYPDGSFKPNNNITRAEFTKLLSTVFPYQAAEYELVEFSDVAETDWYYESVRNLLTFGIIVKDEKFNPDKELTREEAMTMAGRAFGFESENVSDLDKFKDKNTVSEYAVKYVAGLVGAGFVGGYEDETIRPDAKITRAECIKILDSINPVNEKYSLKGIMERIYKGTGLEFPNLAVMDITPESSEYFLGIPDMEFEEAIASEPMMTSKAHSVCLVRVKEGSDIEKIKEEIRTKVNPRKWVCVGIERDQVIVENRDNLIILIMDSFAPDKLKDSFMTIDIKKKPLIEAGNDGLLTSDGYYMDFIGEININGVENFAKKIESLASKYALNNNVFYSVVPSKSYFINDNLKTPYDYNKMFEILGNNIKSAKYINIADGLNLTDYYITDPHWRQDKLNKTVNTLGDSMGFSVDFSKFSLNEVTNFKGQHGYNKQDFPTETIYYLTDVYTENAVVKHEEGTSFNKIYELEKLSSSSPYDMFLSGPSAIATIKNEGALTDKELVIFRDSYSCNLAPLLTSVYKEITLIDLRYVMSTLIDMFVKIENKDVLFLYNDRIVNNGEMLKVLINN